MDNRRKHKRKYKDIPKEEDEDELEDLNQRLYVSRWSDEEQIEDEDSVETSSPTWPLPEMGDEELAREIQESIDLDPILANVAYDIAITVENKFVTLEGPVNSQKEKDAVGDRAAEFVGMDKVRNNLKIIS